MQLPRDGQEYAHITLTGLPAGAAVEVSIDGRDTWHPTDTDGPTTRRVLLRGPDSARTEGLALARTTKLWVRVADNPEQVIRDAGTVYLY